MKQRDIIRKEKNIDLLLLMDCTSSMGSWIKESASQLVSIIKTIRSTCRYDAELRVAYVGYRDFGDRGDDRHFDYLDYTTDHERVSEKILKSVASGGGDCAEDLKGALDKAFTLSHKAPFLHIFLICDAPTHGSQYHDGVSDSHKIQPERSLENSLLKFKNIKSTTCHFTAIQITSQTKKMFDIMKKEFGPEMLVTEKKVPGDFFETMLKSITSTIQSSRVFSEENDKPSIA